MLELEESLIALVQTPYFINEEMEVQGCMWLVLDWRNRGYQLKYYISALWSQMGSFSLHYITNAVQDNFCPDLENVSAELLIIWQSFLSPQI